MFGLSLAKILLTILVIIAVWAGWRVFTRYQALKAARERAVPPVGGRNTESPRAANDARASGRASAGAQARVEAEDMVECRTCGAFIALSRRVACGRKDCPFPG
ncbi:MAG: hypothetical protein A3G73_07380 [Rhodospirillales bacterium RIFCSPLOWO2_12_FULL_67_15]|nr:MAG: hypothetical protein A3G73_07380 [Rhodospirillales bacterium RIFCSPLOWO2_12_FULL_67_15]